MHRLISASSQGFLIGVIDRFELLQTLPSETELAQISAIRAAACFREA